MNTVGPKVWLTPGSISVAVDRLVEKGLVSRKDRAELSVLVQAPLILPLRHETDRGLNEPL